MNCIKHSCFVVVVFIGFSFQVKAQEQQWYKKLVIEGDYHYGFVTPHLPAIAYFVEDHIQGFQITAGIQTDGSKAWQRYKNNPVIGIGYYHSNLGNNKVFGVADAGYFFIDRTYLKNTNRFNIGTRLSFGLGHVNKPYDMKTNNYNYCFSTPWNAFAQLHLEGIVKLTPQLQLKTSIGVEHLSNGAYKYPNKGMNLCTAFTGIRYSFSPYTEKPLQTGTLSDTVKNKILVRLAYGKKQYTYFKPDKYSVYAFSGEYSRKLFNSQWIGVGFANYLDCSLGKELNKTNPDKITSDNIRLVAFVSYELTTGNLSYVIQPGIYLKNEYTENGSMSNRVGLRYKFRNNLVMEVAVKAHWLAIADFVEWGIAYQWNK